MSDTNSARHQLPFLITGQSQKELTHNEALAKIDALLHSVVEAELALPAAPLAVTDAGKCWLVASGASGEWNGHVGKIACWTGGSWRFLAPTAGMRVWNKQNNNEQSYISGRWIAAAAIADVTGGNVIDVEARAVIRLLLGHLRNIGLTAAP